MLVSVVITSYNYADFLAEAIQSALDQNYPDVEVIVIDDGSHDDSAEIIRRFGNRITAVIKENRGQCACCNLGLDLSQGDVLIFLDADDVLLPDAAVKHVQAIKAANAVKSCGYMQVVDEQGRLTGDLIPRHLPATGDYRAITLSKGLDTLRSSFTSGHAWTRTFLKHVMPLPDGDAISVDAYLTSVDRLFGPLAFVDEPVVKYRLHSRNKGPLLFRFEPQYLRKRVARKLTRIDYAESWILRLGLPYDRREFRCSRDWRLTLMRQSLYLMGEDDEPVPAQELIRSPFLNVDRRLPGAALTSAALLAVKLLPRKRALQLAHALLDRSLAGPRLRRSRANAL